VRAGNIRTVGSLLSMSEPLVIARDSQDRDEVLTGALVSSLATNRIDLYTFPIIFLVSATYLRPPLVSAKS
jgi:hypothetical protein